MDTGQKTGIMYGSRITTLWMDSKSGQGVTQDGSRVTAKVGERRKSPNLVDLLDTAASYGARRIMLCGDVPEPQPGVKHWLLSQTPGWTPKGHFLRAPIAGKFAHNVTGQSVDVRTVAEWFPEVTDPDNPGQQLPLNPDQARQAWELTESIVQTINPKQHLLFAPSRTGTSLWWYSLPRDKTGEGSSVIFPKVSPDIAEDLHRFHGQHHIELTTGATDSEKHPDVLALIDASERRKIQSFTYLDGRFMYAGLGRELGVGPGVRLNRAQAYELLHLDPYARATYEVRFTVPDTWQHVGILPVRHENVSDGWFFPNRPGARHTTWADGSELSIALAHGWGIEPLQAIQFDKARPVDTFMTRLDKARQALETNRDLPWMLRKAASNALRSILIQTVGAFASRGAAKTVTVASTFDVPSEYQHTMYTDGRGVVTYERPGDRSNTAGYHPELAIQIWGRGRARLLSAPSALGNNTAGVLTLDPSTVVGVNGDAIYTTDLPAWALPTSRGGGDDGKTGRLRLKGALRGSYLTPTNRDMRDRLRKRAEKAGPAGAFMDDEGGDE